MAKSGASKAETSKEETRWTDASIRWPDDKPKTYDSDEEEEDGPYMDPFKDPDPFNIFSFRFERSRSSMETDGIDINSEDRFIDINIRGYKTDSDEIWESTGLTLWKAAEYLCEYQVDHSELFRGKRILEVRSVS